MYKKLKSAVAMLGLACVALAVCFSSLASAVSNKLNLVNASVIEKSDTVAIENANISENVLSGGIYFRQLDDTITLALTLENTSDISYRIGSVSDNLSENYLTAEYDFNEGEIAPGDTTILDIVLTYANETTEVSSFKIKDYMIVISLLSESGESEVAINPGVSSEESASSDIEKPVENPVTSDGVIAFVVFIVAVSAVVIKFFAIVKDKRAKALIVMFALSSVAILPTTIYAENVDIVEIKFSGITLNAKALSDITTMQEMTHDICFISDDGEKNILVDTREDGINSYIVGKAADGNCWMLQNLRLGSSVVINGSITVDKVKNATGELDGSFELSGKVATDDVFTYYSNNGYDYINDSSQFTCNDDYGCYYNWAAATAETGSSSMSSGDANNSICPKGWSLPSKTQQDTLAAIYSEHSDRLAADTTNSTGAIPGLTFGGGYNYRGNFGVNIDGYYWSRTASIGGGAYNLDIDSSYILVYSRSIHVGSYVRCVAQ